MKRNKGTTDGVEREFDNIRTYRSFAYRAAKDLGYGESVIEDIARAKTRDEISNIMSRARLA